MKLDGWELSAQRTDGNPNRWLIKLKAGERDLMALVRNLPGSPGCPIPLSDGRFTFAVYLYNLQDDELMILKAYLNSLCSSGEIRADAAPEELSWVAPEKPSACPVKPDTAALGFSDMELNARFVFSEFIIGPNSRFVAAAGKAVAENPGKIYNPFFIYGGVGLGKTHLMQAVGNQVRATLPDLRVVYVSTEKLMTEVVDSIRAGSLPQLREHYRTVDLLLVDDVHFLVESESTQEEFFHIFNVLHQNGKQIILTSDRPPKLLTSLEDRLRSRFEWGLIADIKAPNLETRVAILKQKGQTNQLVLDESILRYIATKLKSNVRELEGFLKRIQAFSAISGQGTEMAVVKNLMSELLPVEERDPEIGVPVPAPQVKTAERAIPPPVPAPPRIPVHAPAPPALVDASGGREDAATKIARVAFFHPEGKEAELQKVIGKFHDVIVKHKLKFKLEGVFSRGYSVQGKINHSLFSELCKTNNVTIAIVLGPPRDVVSDAEDFENLLTTVMEDQHLALQYIPWHEQDKDYRYLNLALDITLLKHRV